MKRELLRAEEEVKRIQSVPLFIGQFLEMVDANSGVVSSTTGAHRPLTPLLTVPHELRWWCVSTARMLGVSDSLHGQFDDPGHEHLDQDTRRAFLWCIIPANRHLERAGANYYVRILSTLNRELLKPSSSVALHRHSNALVDILPPEADSSIAMLGDHEKPDVTYADIGGNDIQKQEIREAVELPLSNPGLYAQVHSWLCSCRVLMVGDVVITCDL